MTVRLAPGLESRYTRRLAREVARLGLVMLVIDYSGYADRLVLLPAGATLFVEVKRPGEKLRPLQEYRREQLARFGHFTMVAVGDDGIDQVIKYIREFIHELEFHPARVPAARNQRPRR